MNGNKKVSRVASVLLVLIMVFGLLISPIMQLGGTAVYADETHQVATWQELVDKIGAANPNDVIQITGNINAEGTITIDKKITIQGDGNKRYIYQKSRTSYDTLFKVVANGDLTLGTNLVLSGKTVTCTNGNATIKDGTEPNTHQLSSFEKTDTGNQTAKFQIASPSGYLGTFDGTEAKLYTSVPSNVDTTVEIEVKEVPLSSGGTINKGFLKLKGKYVYPGSSGSLELKAEFNPDTAMMLIKDTLGPATTVENNKSYYFACGTNYVRYYTDGENHFLHVDATSPTLEWKASDVTAAGSGSPYWMIPNAKPLDNENNLVRYDTQPEAEDALKKLNEEIDPIPYKYIDAIGDTNSEDRYYNDGSGNWKNSNSININTALEEYNASQQTCDGGNCPEPKNTPTYTGGTGGTFADGTITQPHGFFVQVQDKGKATLNGATLEHFITSRDKGTTPRYVAPVTVWGTGSTFDVVSGEIKDNIVGYIVDDGMANKSANVIKSYIKGGAPNAARKGTYADKKYRRNSKAGIDNNDAGSGITATAGAIIYANGGKGEITGGNIGFNRGDTGGIMATGEGTEVALKNDTNINNNVGVQFGGGVTTEDGATINMHDGIIQKNVAWFGGGGVYATENGVEWLLGNRTLEGRKDGKFNMFDGTIAENTAFTRGGGFFVDSDGVSLLKGTIRDNLSHMLGGAMYVMGDDANFTYTVYINKGYVHENKAVSAGPKDNPYQDSDNKKLSQLLSAPSGCARTDAYKLLDGYMSVNSDDVNDGYPPAPHDASDGTGGGIWLCAYGNTVLNVGDDSFIIDKNYASGSFRHGKAAENNKVDESTSSGKAGGNDIHKETKGSGNIVIFGITDNSVKWYDENTGEQYTSPANAKNGAITDYSLKNLTNKGSFAPSQSDYEGGKYQGVDVYGNMSRRGGGLAADGTFLFGNFRALGQAYSELAVTKTWAGGTEPKKVTIRISLEYKDGNATKTIPVIELPLDESAKEGSELDTVFTDGSETIDGKTVYKGHIVLPITVDDGNGKQIQLFDLVSDVDGHIFALDNAQSLYELGQYLKNGGPGGAPGTVSLSTLNRKLVYEELVDDGNGNLVKAAGFEITPSSMRLSTNPPPKIYETEIKQAQTGGGETTVGSMITSDIRFEADLYNDKPSEIDKYVNKAVHKDIELDEVFEYDVIAYVKHGTDKIVIEDQLVNDLEFVSAPAEVKVVSLTENNHLPKNDISGELVNDTASVAEAGTAITNKKVEIKDNKLTVSIENKLDEIKDVNGKVIGYKNADTGQDLKDLWGKWVKVTYKAQIKKEFQNKIKSGEMSIKDLKDVTVKGNGKYKDDASIFVDPEERPEPNVGNDPVKSDEDHKGIPNTASYSLEVKNEPAFRDESNTVTVRTTKIDMPFEKIWDEYMADSGRRPASIVVHLLANGKRVEGKSMTITEGVDWKGVFKSLPRFDDSGKDIEYTLEEEPVEYYYADMEWVDATYRVVNHTRPWIPRLPMTPGNVGHVNVTKTVSGAAEKNKNYEIEVKFTFADGEEYTHELVLNPESNPSFLFDYIPVGTKVEVSEKTTGYNTTFKTDGKESSDVVVEIGKTHEVVINNDKPGRGANTGDSSRPFEWIAVMVIVGLTITAMVYRRRFSK